MRAAIRGITRANGRLYVSLSAPCDTGAKPEARARLADGSLIPCSLYPDGNDSFVACLPVMDVPLTLSIHTPDDGGPSREVLRRTISPGHARWESRVRSRVSKAFTERIRGFEDRFSARESHLEFVDALYGPTTFVVHADLVLAPGDEVGDDLVVCYVTTDGTRGTAGLVVLDDPHDGRLPVSLIVDQLPMNFAFSVKGKEGEQGPFGSRLSVLEKHVLDDMLADYATTCMDKADWSDEYDVWRRAHLPTEEELQRQRGEQLSPSPRFSLIVPLFRTPLPLLGELLDSIRSQTYQDWELVLVNASPEDEGLASAVAEAVAGDERIHAVDVETNGGISRNTNVGIERATGDFVSFLDHDDVLGPNLLYEYARAVRERPDTDLIYCDEDKFDQTGRFFSPFFKPDFNLDLIRDHNYICHMLTIRRSLLEEVGPLDPACDGAQDYDLTLRACERARHVHHVPGALYHWRVWTGSSAGNEEAKPYTDAAGHRALSSHIRRLGIDATVENTPSTNIYYVRYAIPEHHPLVSVVIPVERGDDRAVRGCVDSVLASTSYAPYELILVPCDPDDEASRLACSRLAEQSSRIRVVTPASRLSRTDALNLGATGSRGEYLLSLSAGARVVDPSWLGTMVGNCSRPEVGIVGARLVYPDATIAHAGLSFSRENIRRLFHGLHATDWGYYCFAFYRMDLSAVGLDCTMMSASLFEELGGVDEGLGGLCGAIDLCLRMRARDLLVVYAPEVVLELRRCPWQADPDEGSAWPLLRKRWHDVIEAGDPCYSRVLDTPERRSWYYGLPTP